ncbi:hypothetical protein D3273_16885 [Lichenibacterium minor]|uniref:DUF4347 domain-containing protein n=1 Tax=Lichenibacterium minor TaxID=2316528 RepID=A0A4Q2U700_9HYPH|nr:hypothetical protein [Lichenibacterium minor]RYC30861.1 hypothetical protein D3273_16885 [Lichenibacterium minor]
MSGTGLAIVECRWWEHGNDSVRPLFETLAGIVEDNPHDVRYDMFADRSSLEAIIGTVADAEHYHTLYIASHGNQSELGGVGGARISRTELRNAFRNKNTDGNIIGIYFGSCLIGNVDNAAFFLEGTNLMWIAGYKESVDWIDSSAIDMIFWSKYLHERKRNRSRRRNKKSEIDMVLHASKEMKNLVPNVFTQMGFNIYQRSAAGSIVGVW